MTRGVPLSFFNEEVSLITRLRIRLRIDLTRLGTLAGGGMADGKVWDHLRLGSRKRQIL